MRDFDNYGSLLKHAAEIGEAQQTRQCRQTCLGPSWCSCCTTPGCSGTTQFADQ